MFMSCQNQKGHQVEGQKSAMKPMTSPESSEHVSTRVDSPVSESREPCQIDQQSRLSCALLESSTRSVPGESHVVQRHGDAVRRPGRSPPTPQCVREALRGRAQYGHEHDPGRTPTGENHLRQSPYGQTVLRGLGNIPRLGEVVPDALSGSSKLEHKKMIRYIKLDRKSVV